jgi:hypothetical protein
LSAFPYKEAIFGQTLPIFINYEFVNVIVIMENHQPKAVDPAFLSVSKNSSAFIIWRVEVGFFFIVTNYYINLLRRVHTFPTGVEIGPTTERFAWEIL